MACRFRAWLSLLLLAVALPAVAAPHWEVRYFYDADNSDLTILDLAFPSANRGIAVGYLTIKRRKIQPRVLLTRDGGKSWSLIKIKEHGRSLFFLNDSVGWMITGKGIWQTVESGRSWRKISKLRGLLRLYFLDEHRGWAVGLEKSIYQTTDGGHTWKPLPVADRPETTKKYTTYSWIDFSNQEHGTIVGYSNPPRKRRSRFPDWMVPERASRFRQYPTLTIVIQTLDGGRTWKSTTTSIFGRITRLRLNRNGVGLALVRFQHSFRWPSEVFSIDLRKNKQTHRVFRRKNRSITDVLITGDQRYFLAGFEPVGKLFDNPVPGRLVVLMSRDMIVWREMKVDYRAYAHNAMLAASPDGSVWVATDLGMILKLTGN